MENISMNAMKSNEEKEIVELYYDFQKAYDNVNHGLLMELLDCYSFPLGVVSRMQCGGWFLLFFPFLLVLALVFFEVKQITTFEHSNEE